MKALAENLWLLRYPLKLFGADLRRNVTVIRLRSGEIIIHSSAPFEPPDVAKIRSLGKPTWMVEANRFHDTFSREAHDIFTEVQVLAPAGFSESVNFPTEPLMPAPATWAEEIDVLAVQGTGAYDEHVMLHRSSRTLIVGDLAFNFPPEEPMWTEFLVRTIIGSEHQPGMSRPFRLAITDESAFRWSMDVMLQWDFDRVIVGHGDMIESGGREKIALMLDHAGF
jgi:hypothetical protein